MYSRRQFIGCGTAALAAASGRVFGVEASNRVRLAIVGCREGGRGSAVLSAALKVPGVDVVWVCDVDSRARDHGVDMVRKATGRTPRAAADLRKVLEDPSLDGVILETPDHWHAYGAVMAMEAGKHVYVEKPCCFCPREGELLVDTWHRTGKVLQVGSQRRSSASVRAAMEFLKSKPLPIGELRLAKCWYMGGRRSCGPGPAAPVPEWLDWDLWQGPAPRTEFRDNYVHYNWHWFRRWGTAETGNNAPHFADVARWALGVRFPERVVAAGGLLFPKGDDYEWPDTCDFSLEYPGGRMVSFDVASHTGDSSRYGMSSGAIVYGEGGSARFLPDDSVEVFDEKGASMRRWGRDSAIAADSRSDPTANLDVRHLADFVECIRSGSQRTAAPADEGYMSSYMPLVANIALDAHESIRLDPANGAAIGSAAAAAAWRREYEPGWELLGG